MVNSKQRGFTLIELVVVIVILGILAAFAVPRFMGMEGEARAATVKSMGGSLLAAASLARGKCQAQDCGAAGVVIVDNVQITMANGYPNAASIAATMDLANAGFGAPALQANGRMRFTKNGGGANCFVEYVPAANANARATVAYAWAVNNANFNRNLSDACRG